MSCRLDARPVDANPSQTVEEVKRDSTATGSTDDGGRTAEEPIRIGLADDHVVVRSGLCMLLDSESDFEVVAEAGDVQSAANLVREHHARVLVLDLNMPGGSSLEAIPHIRQESPDTQVVVLTMEQDPAFACEALGAGALGYVLKEGADDELVEAVRCAAAGEGYLSSRLGARLASEDPLVPDDDLSAREIEVLTLLALGHTNSETADLLLLSVRSVEAYRKRVQEKLLLHGRAELVGYALEPGLITPKARVDEEREKG